MGMFISAKKNVFLEKRCQNVMKSFKLKRLSVTDSNNNVSEDDDARLSQDEDDWTCKVLENVKNLKFESETDVKSLKLQSSIVLKRIIKRRYETLDDISLKLNKLLEYSWNKLTNKVKESKPPKINGVVSKNCKTIPEVAEFQEFVIKYQGHYGGWEEFDHLTFLKLIKKYKSENKSKMIDELLDILFGQTRQTTELHVKWFEEYNVKRKRMKDAIHRWRKEKEIQKALSQELITPNPDLEKYSEEQRKLVKKSIEMWKIKCQELKIQEKLRKEKEELDQKQRELKWMKKQRELKEELEKRRVKLEEEAKFIRETDARKTTEEEKEKHDFANKELEKYRQKDFEKIKYIVNQKETKEMEKKMKEKRSELLRKKLAIEVPFDPERIYKPTKVWLVHSSFKRIRPISSITKANYILTLHQIKHRSITKRSNSKR